MACVEIDVTAESSPVVSIDGHKVPGILNWSVHREGSGLKLVLALDVTNLTFVGGVSVAVDGLVLPAKVEKALVGHVAKVYGVDVDTNYAKVVLVVDGEVMPTITTDEVEGLLKKGEELARSLAEKLKGMDNPDVYKRSGR